MAATYRLVDGPPVDLTKSDAAKKRKQKLKTKKTKTKKTTPKKTKTSIESATASARPRARYKSASGATTRKPLKVAAPRVGNRDGDK